jgi:hypothetical protein
MLPRALAAPHVSRLEPALEFRAFDQPRLRQPIRQAAMIRAIIREIRRFDPDVIHYQSCCDVIR